MRHISGCAECFPNPCSPREPVLNRITTAVLTATDCDGRRQATQRCVLAGFLCGLSTSFLGGCGVGAARWSVNYGESFHRGLPLRDRRQRLPRDACWRVNRGPAPYPSFEVDVLLLEILEEVKF